MLMNSLSIIVRYSRVFCEHKLREFDIGFPEQVILMYLSENRKANQEDISKYFMIDKGAIAKTISKLEEKRFIERHENPENRREKLVLLSEKGDKMITYMKEILEEWNQLCLDGIPEEENRQFERTVGIMTKNITKKLI
jgi:DNA-binding MarR family transcriptional regulator